MMTPEQCNMIITALQSVSSSIELVGQMLLLLVVTHLVGWFMK